MKTIEEVVKKKEKCVWAITELKKLLENFQGKENTENIMILIKAYDGTIQTIGGYSRKDEEAEKERSDLRERYRKGEGIIPFCFFIKEAIKTLEDRIRTLDWFMEE